MPDPIIPKEELDEIKKDMPELQRELSQDEEKRTRFFSNPFKYLRERYNWKILARIADVKELIDDFNESVKKMFDKLKTVFNQCFGCKFSCLLIIYGALAKLSLPITAVLGKIDAFVSLLLGFFSNTSKEANEVVRKIQKGIDFLKPSGLAIKFCQIIQACPEYDVIV